MSVWGCVGLMLKRLWAAPTQVLIGGGQEASQVTTTSSRAGKFESRFFHKVLLLHRMRPCILQYLYWAHDV